MSSLPAGTVTFLFTDIEGSTRKWQYWPHKMKIALKRHDDILRKSIEENGGWVFKTVGDAFCAAFHTAMDCINSVIAIQTAINAEEWDLPERIKVRMSIHTGEAIERNNDYYGPALNRVARLEALAYGGQVLMSLVTAELIRDMLLPPAELKCLGKHRLKDLTRPEEVYQLVYPGLPEDFPPVKSLDSHPHNLPVQPGLLVGRQPEIEILSRKLLGSRFRAVTVTGTGGMGKTRISLQLGAELIEHFKDGVFFVDLTAISDASGLYPLILSTLSVKESGSKSPFGQLKEYLADKEILLILDNFEHLMDAASDAAALLSECPGLKYLVTSREALHIRGEGVFRLPPLKIPVINRDKPVSLKKLTQYDSVNLFIERAEEIDENFRVNSKNAAAVAEICIRLDGIPLAIELAAARISALSPNALLRRLNHRLEMLTYGAVDLPERQQTLRTTIEWSCNLLDEQMKRFFAALSVFRGSFDMETAGYVLSNLTDLKVIDGVEHLLQKSFLMKKDDEKDEPRFYMLETINEFASGKLENSGFSDEIKEKHASFFYRMVQQGEKGITSPDQKSWMDRLFREEENIDAALSLYLDTGRAEEAGEMAVSLRPYWEAKGRFSAGIDWYQRILEELTGEKELGNRLLTALGAMYLGTGDYGRAEGILEKAAAGGSLLPVYYLAWACFRANDQGRAEELFERSIVLAAGEGREIIKAKSIAGKGLVYQKMGEPEKAEESLKEALSFLRTGGDPRSIAQTTNNLGLIAYGRGNYPGAEEYFAAAYSKSRLLGDKAEVKKLLNNLGYLNCKTGDFKAAAKYYRELQRESEHDNLFLGTSLYGLAIVDIESGKPDSALRNAEKAVSVLDKPALQLDYAIALRVLGDVRRFRKEYTLSKECYTKAIPILEKYGEEEDLELARKGFKAPDENK